MWTVPMNTQSFEPASNVEGQGYGMSCGAAAIAEFLFGDSRRKRIIAETTSFPDFRPTNRRIYICKPVLRSWMPEQEQSNYRRKATSQ